MSTDEPSGPTRSGMRARLARLALVPLGLLLGLLVLEGLKHDRQHSHLLIDGHLRKLRHPLLRAALGVIHRGVELELAEMATLDGTLELHELLVATSQNLDQLQRALLAGAWVLRIPAQGHRHHPLWHSEPTPVCHPLGLSSGR